jgi:hypothetical protein
MLLPTANFIDKPHMHMPEHAVPGKEIRVDL